MIVLPPGAIARPAPAAPPSGGGGGFRAQFERAAADDEGRAAGAGSTAGAPVAARRLAGPPTAAGTTPPSGAAGVAREGHLTVATPRDGLAPGEGPGAAFLRRALEGQRHLDAAVAAASRGRTFSPAELLGLQARLYRATEAVQLFSKTVEQASAAVKQTLRTPV